MVHIITTKSIHEFIRLNPEFENALEAWITSVKYCNWEKPEDIVRDFGSKAVDLLGKKDNKPTTVSSKRVVFDIKGNHLRIIAKYQFHHSLEESRLYIKWIGRHKDYDKICAQNQQFEIEMFKK